MVCNPRQNLVQEKIWEIVFSKEILFLIKLKKKYSDKISSLTKKIFCQGKICQKENFFEKKFIWEKFSLGKNVFVGKNFCQEKILLEKNFFERKLFWENIFFEKIMFLLGKKFL